MRTLLIPSLVPVVVELGLIPVITVLSAMLLGRPSKHRGGILLKSVRLILRHGWIIRLPLTSRLTSAPILPSGTVNLRFLILSLVTPRSPTLISRLVAPTNVLLSPFGPTVVLARTIPKPYLFVDASIRTEWLIVSMTFRAIASDKLRLSGPLTVSIRLLVSSPEELLNVTVRVLILFPTPSIVTLASVLALTNLVAVPLLLRNAIRTLSVPLTIRPPAITHVVLLAPPKTIFEFALSLEVLSDRSNGPPPRRRTPIMLITVPDVRLTALVREPDEEDIGPILRPDESLVRLALLGMSVRGTLLRKHGMVASASVEFSILVVMADRNFP